MDYPIKCIVQFGWAGYKSALLDYSKKNNITIEGLEDFDPTEDPHDHHEIVEF